MTNREGEARAMVRRSLSAALMLVVVASGLLLVTAGEAVACTCVRVRSEAELAARADAVFVGDLVGQRTGSLPSISRSGGSSRSAPVVLTFKVSRVVKGAVSERQEIVTPGGGEPACGGFGIGLRGTGPFLVYAFDSAGDMYQPDSGRYASNLCSGSRAVSGTGMPAAGGPTRAQLAAGIGLLAAVVAAGLVVLTTRRRSSPG